MQLGAVVFTLSGVLDNELAARLEALIASEADGGIVLDLKDVTLVDRTAVRFLAGVEAAGNQIVNFPADVGVWIAAGEEKPRVPGWGPRSEERRVGGKG